MLSDAFFVTRWNKWITVNRLAVGAQISVYYQRRLSCDCESPAPVRDSWLPMLSCTTGHNTHEKKGTHKKKGDSKNEAFAHPPKKKEKNKRKTEKREEKKLMNCGWSIQPDNDREIINEPMNSSLFDLFREKKMKGIQHPKKLGCPARKKNGGNDICSRSNALLYGKRLRLSLYPHLINDLDWFSQRHFSCVCWPIKRRSAFLIWYIHSKVCRLCMWKKEKCKPWNCCACYWCNSFRPSTRIHGDNIGSENEWSG